MAGPWRLCWLLVIGVHAVGAGGWWWLMPGGFPPSHPRFWSNGFAPVVVLGVVASAVVAARRNRLRWLCGILAAFPGCWLAAALAARMIFPITFGRLFAVPLFGAGLMGLALAFASRRWKSTAGRSVWISAALGGLFGAASLMSLRPHSPDTRPIDGPMPEMPESAGTEAEPQNPRLFVDPGEGSITLKAGSLTLFANPLLKFLSRSPDGCLTILAPAAFREPPGLRLISESRRGGATSLRYRSDYDASLEVGPDEGPIVLEATARLPRPIYSHLNSFCDIEVSGHRRLALAFSPCPDRLVEVRPADYPTGRPLRFAYRDAEGAFRVVEATSGEKGPFRELAAGRMARSEPLAITLHDSGAAVARITLDDWAAQAGTALSPTAGWGAPVNAIEFSLHGDSPRSSAGIYVTLAGTSVGRGWDSVGHAAGTYRNRMRIEVLPGRASTP